MDRVVGGRKGWLTALALAAFCGWTAPEPANAQTSYSILELQGVAQRINQNGEIAGWVYVGADAHAAVYSGGAWRDLGVAAPDDQLSALFDINSAGAVVGYSFASLPGPDNRWQAVFAPAGATTVQALSVVAPDSFAYAINDTGAIAGCLNRYDDVFPDPHRAFLYSGGTVTDLHALLAGNPTLDFTCARDLNNLGAVVGEVQSTSAPQRGFLYQGGTVTLLQQGVAYLTNARAISNAGLVVGEGRIAGYTADHAVVYNVATGAISGLGLETTGAFNSRPNDVNGNGDVVGMMFLAVGEHAFLVSDGAIADLNDLLPNGSEWVLQEALSINDGGQIVGRGYLSSSPTVTRYFLMDPSLAPEGSLSGLIAQVRALLAQGLLGRGPATALVAKLETAERHLDGRCSRLAVQSLESFVRQVDQLIRTRHLQATKGEPLIDEANRIIDELLSSQPAPKKHFTNGHRCVGRCR